MVSKIDCLVMVKDNSSYYWSSAINPKGPITQHAYEGHSSQCWFPQLRSRVYFLVFTTSAELHVSLSGSCT